MATTPFIKSKLPQTGTTIFTVMSSLAARHNAINLGQGFPDFMMDTGLMELVTRAMMDGHNQYAHMNGLPQLREALAEKVLHLYNATIHPETEITITPGGTYAIYTAFTTVLQPGDEVIVFEPSYDSYIPNIIINGGVPVLIPLSFPGYAIDWNLVKAAITSKTKMIVLNSPHNPTGNILSKEDIQQLQAIVAGTGIFILSDEVYEHITFDNVQHQSMLLYPDLAERSFTCFSFGKTYNCTGWKLGYCIAPAAFMNEFRKVHQFNCFSCNTPVQFALSAFLKYPENYLGLGKFIQHKRDYFQALMKQTMFDPSPSHGGYFQLYSYKNISDENDFDFAGRMIKEYGVAAVPLSAFYTNPTDNKVVRFCFVKAESTLEEAVRRLVKLK